jgi:hypothetical protein
MVVRCRHRADAVQVKAAEILPQGAKGQQHQRTVQKHH